MTLKSYLKYVAIIAALAATAVAQDSGALLDLLVKKGIVTDAEAENLRAELTRDSAAAVVSTISGGKSTIGLSLTGRIQAQFAGLDTDIGGPAADPAATQHFFLRRVYLGAKATLGAGWTANLNYDFAGSTFDAAFLQWRKSDALVLDFGFRKAPIGLDEWFTSSSALKAIERSPGTRYFVEGNNGRRLGAGSYRVGAYAGGKLGGGVFYNLAITNPERDESASGVAGSGSAANNTFAYWANLGYTGTVAEDTKYTLSGSIGLLPDQGGKTLGAGDDLTVYNAFAQVLRGPLSIEAEYWMANVDRGVSATQDATPYAYSVQLAYLVGKLEPVIRYSYVDSDHRGVNLSDGIRSAPSGGTMNTMTEWFAGLNYYFQGNDVKLQAGYIHGESDKTAAGAPASASVQGIRSQLQINF